MDAVKEADASLVIEEGVFDGVCEEVEEAKLSDAAPATLHALSTLESVTEDSGDSTTADDWLLASVPTEPSVTEIDALVTAGSSVELDLPQTWTKRLPLPDPVAKKRISLMHRLFWPTRYSHSVYPCLRLGCHLRLLTPPLSSHLVLRPWPRNRCQNGWLQVHSHSFLMLTYRRDLICVKLRASFSKHIPDVDSILMIAVYGQQHGGLLTHPNYFILLDVMTSHVIFVFQHSPF